MDIIFMYLLHGIVAAFLILAAFQDARTREVSNWNSVGIFVSTIILMVNKRHIDLSGVLPGVIMAFLYLIGFDNHFRGADVKLLAALGLYLGLHGCLLMLLIASFSSLIYEGIRYLVTREKREAIPFCSWMGIAGTIILATQIF